MDAAFRDATLKGPLWDEVSRKLGELGYRRSAKKCKEKFENVHKYYKRTKESRAGRPDGKTYRFFSQLEALHGSTPGAGGTGGGGYISPAPVLPISFAPAAVPLAAPAPVHAMPGHSASAAAAAEFRFFSSADESDDEDTEEIIGGADERGKRKRAISESSGGGEGPESKILEYFEELMRKMVERQEAMQQQFLETMEKREHERAAREEAWRRQEAARLAREQEILTQERAMAASRDAAIVALVQKLTGQTFHLPSSFSAPVITVLPPQPPPPPPPPQPPVQQSPLKPAAAATSTTPPAAPPPQPPQSSLDLVQAVTPPAAQIIKQQQHQHNSVLAEGGASTPGSSRWPKAEVHALIQLRSELETRYQEAGPKGPLWEEISSGMRRLGYSRSSKRCKEKWENINKYFKKVKESNKKRTEDSKTCPYFHQLDTLYRTKAAAAAAAAAASAAGGGTALPRPAAVDGQEASSFGSKFALNNMPAPLQVVTPSPLIPQQAEAKNGTDSAAINGGGVSGVQLPAVTNGPQATVVLFGEAKKELGDAAKMTMEQRPPQPQPPGMAAVMNAVDSDMDDDEFDDEDDYDEDDEDEPMQYEMFQRQDVRPAAAASAGGAGSVNAPPTTSTAANAATATAGGGSFITMVQ